MFSVGIRLGPGPAIWIVSVVVIRLGPGPVIWIVGVVVMHLCPCPAIWIVSQGCKIPLSRSHLVQGE